jgi:hypothetical protein
MNGLIAKPLPGAAIGSRTDRVSSVRMKGWPSGSREVADELL